MASAEELPMTVHPPGGDRFSGVLIDATSLPPQLGGVGRYVQGLLAGLHELGFVPAVVAKREHIPQLMQHAPSAWFIPASRVLDTRGTRFAWEQTALPRLAHRIGADVIHSPHYTFPVRFDGRRVVTVHDATSFSDPASHTRVKSVFFQWWLRRGAHADVHLVAPSQATSDEVERFVGAPRQPIVVAHHGVDRSVFRKPEPAEIEAFKVSAGLRPDERWIAFLGTIEPRKQVAELLRAHQLLRKRRPDAPTLLISGQRGWDTEAIELLDRLGLEDGVRELGYLPLDELRALLGGSQMVVYSSLAEGFGLPVLEAMQCAAPVLTTRVTSLPEVGGDAVAYVSEVSPTALADAMERLLDDEEGRRELSVAAAERAARFTWTATAEAHLAAYGV